ncbi:MAG: CheR family methyltransferase [Myxococcota bacterium]
MNQQYSVHTSSAQNHTRLLQETFQLIRHLIFQLARVDLLPSHQVMVEQRLMKLVRLSGARSFHDYLMTLQREKDPEELEAFVDALTTHETKFFREPRHYEFVKEVMLPQLSQTRHPLRFWSAASSTGEEAWSLAMVLDSGLQAERMANAAILGTDISQRVVDDAGHALYPADACTRIPPHFQQRYLKMSSDRKLMTIADQLRSKVHFACLNLHGPWPMKGQFDLIMCRNVLIYFNQLDRVKLLMRLAHQLRPGGYLMISQTETALPSDVPLELVEPSVYQRAATERTLI